MKEEIILYDSVNMEELVAYLPTYRISPNEIVMRMTPDEFKQIDQGLKMLGQRNKSNRNRYVSKYGNEPRQLKPTLRLADPIDATQQPK